MKRKDEIKSLISESSKKARKWLDKDVYFRIGKGTLITNNGSILTLIRNAILLVVGFLLIKHLIYLINL